MSPTNVLFSYYPLETIVLISKIVKRKTFCNDYKIGFYVFILKLFLNVIFITATKLSNNWRKDLTILVLTSMVLYFLYNCIVTIITINRIIYFKIRGLNNGFVMATSKSSKPLQFRIKKPIVKKRLYKLSCNRPLPVQLNKRF